MALFPSIGSYYCWAGAVSIIGANRAGISLSLIPLFSSLMAIAIYNEIFQSQRKRIFNALKNSDSDSVIKFKEVLKKIINGKK